jgi:hypothetical protein
MNGGGAVLGGTRSKRKGEGPRSAGAYPPLTAGAPRSSIVRMNDEPLIPLTDEEIAFAVRMALGLDGRGRMSKPPRAAESWDAQAKRVAEHFRRSKMLVFRKGGHDLGAATPDAVRWRTKDD